MAHTYPHRRVTIWAKMCAVGRPQARQHLPPGRSHRRGNVVVRRHLLKRLESAIDKGSVCAKAAVGSGTSTLVATWLDTLPPSTQTVWLTLRPEHNDSLVLDDVHLIHSGRVTDAVGSILGQLHAGSCIVVCGRADAGLPWAVSPSNPPVGLLRRPWNICWA